MSEETGLAIQDTSLATLGMSVDAFESHLKEFNKFISSQLRPDHDYGVIPGTDKPSLYKPGAEKMLKLFGFKSQMQLIESTTDFEKGLIVYTYKCKVGKYSESGTFFPFAECEANCHNQEVKYKYRWVDEKKVLNPEPMEVMNTIQKMAQKRAFVGAVLLACGASEYYTQDLEDMSRGDTGGSGNRSKGEAKKDTRISPDAVVGMGKKHPDKTWREVIAIDMSFIDWFINTYECKSEWDKKRRQMVIDLKAGKYKEKVIEDQDSVQEADTSAVGATDEDEIPF